MRAQRGVTVFLAALGACATTARHEALSRVTSSFVVDRPLPEVWPLANETLAERHFLAFPSGQGFRIETAIVSPEGDLPNPGSPSKGGPAAATPAGGRGGGGRGVPRPGGSPEGPRGRLVRFIVEGVAIDGTHCQVRFTRYDREAMDELESSGQRDAELEWLFISKAVPDRAKALRNDLVDAGVVPPAG